jgi:hypothetical protein
LERIRNSHSSNNYIKNNICDIFGLEDFDICFKNLKRAIQNVAFNEVNLTFCNEIPLELRFHQDMITYKQMKRMSAEKELLLGAKARSGKIVLEGYSTNIEVRVFERIDHNSST